MRIFVFIALLAIGLVFSTFNTGCSAVSKGADTAKEAVIDCGSGELSKVQAVAVAMAPSIVDGSTEWKDVESAAIAMGYRFGGCLLRHLYDALPTPAGLIGVPTQAELALFNLRRATETNYRYQTPTGTL